MKIDVKINFTVSNQDYPYVTITTDKGTEKSQVFYVFQNDKYLPIWMNAFKELFGVKNLVTESSEAVKTAPNESTSILFEESFQDGNDKNHVVFASTINSNKNDQKISAVTYKEISGQWRVISKQLNFDKIVIGGISEAKPFQLTTKSITFLVENHMGGVMGGLYSYENMILDYSSKNWHILGYIGTSESWVACNRRQCSDCDGTISIINGKKEYPDFLVTKTGVEEDDKGNIIPAKNDIYVFNGKQYEKNYMGASKNSKSSFSREERVFKSIFYPPSP